jgi:hypothetical protein
VSGSIVTSDFVRREFAEFDRAVGEPSIPGINKLDSLLITAPTQARKENP